MLALSELRLRVTAWALGFRRGALLNLQWWCAPTCTQYLQVDSCTLSLPISRHSILTERAC